MSKLVKYNLLNYDSITYNKPENQSNIYFGSMNYDSQPFLLQTSRLIFKGIKEDDKNHKYICVSVEPNDFSFYDTLIKLDDYNLEQTYQNSTTWFNKELPMDILETMYTRITKPLVKGSVPEFEFKLPYFKQNLQTKVYDDQNLTMDIQNIKPGSIVLGMFHIKGLKFLKKNYYCEMVLSQIKMVRSIQESISGGCMIEDDPMDQRDPYDYEIIDQEAVEYARKQLEIKHKISELNSKMEEDQNELSKLNEILLNLK